MSGPRNRGRIVRGLIAVAFAGCVSLPRFGDRSFDPFEAAQKGFDYLDCVTV
jgi:hypothetical protein